MEFKIDSEQGYNVVFSDREFDTKGWISHYMVTLNSPAMKGSVRVYNAPYGTIPASLFQTIDNERQGLNGKKEWASMEGEFERSASSDRTGHITIQFSIYNGHEPPASKMEIECIIESG